MFYPLGKNSEKPYGGLASTPPLYVRRLVKQRLNKTVARLTKSDKLWFVERDAVCSSPGRTNTQGL